MEKYLQNGREIFDKYCTTAGNQPTMLPRAPEQVYIDVYPDEDHPSSFRDDKQRQSDYEAEVKIYRTLEKLEEDLIVLHNFEYTHHQYRLCDKSHVRQKCRKCKGLKMKTVVKEGECDFLVICQEFVVIIEVKNVTNFIQCEPDFHLCTIDEDRQRPRCDLEAELLSRTFRKSVSQGQKTASLIKCIDKDTTVRQFTAYPNFSKQFKEQFQTSEITESQLSDTELSTVIFKEDIDNFSDWWSNITQQLQTPDEPTRSTNTPSYNPDVRNMLLAIWATEKNNCDQSKCSLARCIIDIDRRLREGLFTFESKKGKNRAQNPGVVKAPEVIRNNIEVQNLTTQQEQVFNSHENLLWINGPAGAGKTVVLCGKMIQLVQSDRDNKVVLFRFIGEGNNSQLYQRALDKANVQYNQIITDQYRHTPSQLANLISESECHVVIVEETRWYLDTTQFTDLLSLVKDYNLFIDDVQGVLIYSTAEECSVLIDTLLVLSSDNFVWVACDMVQCWYLVDTQNIINLANVITDKLQSNQWTTLSMNLRNTFNLSNILSVVRDKFIKLFPNRLYKAILTDMILPTQIPGHFIHGPKTIIHILDNYNVEIIGKVLNMEFDKLCNNNIDTLSNSDIGIVHNYLSSDVLSLVKDTVNVRCDNTNDKIAVCNTMYSYSAEWPAVIVLHEMWRYSELTFLTTLYLKISRARVHCSVVLYPEEGTTLEDNSYMLDELLRDHTHIIRHYR